MHRLIYVAPDEYGIQTHLKLIFLDLIAFKLIKFIGLHVTKYLCTLETYIIHVQQWWLIFLIDYIYVILNRPWNMTSLKFNLEARDFCLKYQHVFMVYNLGIYRP
jgi:ABC-type uncharacterized transport system YnjBCD permease subunit